MQTQNNEFSYHGLSNNTGLYTHTLGTLKNLIDHYTIVNIKDISPLWQTKEKCFLYMKKILDIESTLSYKYREPQILQSSILGPRLIEIIKYQSLIKTKFYIKDKKLVCLFKFPLAEKTSFSLSKLYSTPFASNLVNHYKIILPNILYVALDGSNSLYITFNSLQDLLFVNFQYFGLNRKYENAKLHSTCEVYLLLYNKWSASCSTLITPLTEDHLQRINDNNWLLLLPVLLPLRINVRTSQYNNALL